MENFRTLAATIINQSREVSNLRSVAERILASVIEVRAALADGSVVWGPGVVLENGLAVTALHNVADELSESQVAALSDVRAVVYGHGEVRAQLVAAAPNLDLAILRLGVAGVNAAPLALRAPLTGEELLAVGGGSEEIAVVGAAVAESSNCGALLLETERKIDHRFFGGPIFDGEGRLSAMTLTSNGPAKAFAIAALRPLIDQAAQLQ